MRQSMQGTHLDTNPCLWVCNTILLLLQNDITSLYMTSLPYLIWDLQRKPWKTALGYFWPTGFSVQQMEKQSTFQTNSGLWKHMEKKQASQAHPISTVMEVWVERGMHSVALEQRLVPSAPSTARIVYCTDEKTQPLPYCLYLAPYLYCHSSDRWPVIVCVTAQYQLFTEELFFSESRLKVNLISMRSRRVIRWSLSQQCL